jgi:hypothetical protein
VRAEAVNPLRAVARWVQRVVDRGTRDGAVFSFQPRDATCLRATFLGSRT